MRAGIILGVTAVALLTVAMITMAGWSTPPIETEQTGYRGVGMEEVRDRSEIPALIAANQVPEPPWPLEESDAPPASEVYQNVQVLGDIPSDHFDRLMAGLTEWVSPDQGCAYCHLPDEGFEEDSLYTKIVSRHMLRMTRTINAEWKNHVGDTGVTCHTCHRGNPVPEQIWFTDPGPRQAQGLAGYRAGQNTPAPEVGLASLPYDPFTRFLGADGVPNEIRVVGNQALPPESPGRSIQDTESTYALMMHMSDSLGVNCTYCHNSRSFTGWEQSSPARVSAFHGIRMVGAINGEYLEPLNEQYPPERIGPTGDAPKANCATCHQGVPKPLLGADMLSDYPSLAGPAD